MRLACIAVLALTLAGCKGGMERMQVQQKAVPYSDTSLFPDGRAMRSPPAGTVSREQPLGDDAFITGRTKGALVSRIPVRVDAALLARGRERFTIACAPCHGESGDGRSFVAGNMALRPPPSLHDFVDRPDGFFFTVIREGYGVMPSYAPEVMPGDAWAIVAYVRALQLSQRGRIDDAPADVRARLQGSAP